MSVLNNDTAVQKRFSPNMVNKEKRGSKVIKKFRRHIGLYFLLLLPLIYIIIFKYIPMYGVQLAFRDFNPIRGFFGSEWIGFDNFKKFFSSYVLWRLIKNTLGISIYHLIVGFPIPIILAIAVNEVKNKYFKKTVQMVTYAPHFISTVVMVSMLMQFLSPHGGFVNNIIISFGGESINFMGKPEIFKSLYVWTGIWQNMGYSSIIYIAALTSIDPQIHEAAIVDGANKIKRIWNIDIPSILPTAIIMLILSSGQIMNVGFEKTFLMQNPMNISSSEVISTYVYKVGLLNGDFSYATAVGLFNSVINLLLLFFVNSIAKKFSESSLW